MLHVIGFVALVSIVALLLFFDWLFRALGIIKPPPIVPSGVEVGEKALRTLGRDTGWAQRHMEALDKMTVITDAHNGEKWRVLSFEAAIDNQYRFTLLRVG